MEPVITVMYFEGARWDNELMNAGDVQKVEKAKKWILPWSFQKKGSPTNTWTLNFSPPKM